jgi:hopanoid biosynthesis associated protein HpnK
LRRLIINADDFGLTAGVNRAILEAHGHGIVTSATLMANSDAFEEAVRLSKTSPSLSIGCHVVLVDGTPTLSVDKVSTLIGRKNSFRFCPTFGTFASRAVRGRLDPDHLEAEATAQILKLKAAGIDVAHFDTHKHTHMFPAVLRPLLRAAHACGVRALRNPFAPVRSVLLGHLARSPKMWSRFAQVNTLRSMARNFRRTVQEQGLITTDGTFGVLGTGVLDLKLFQSIVACIPDGTWEFVCHPGYNDKDLSQVRTRLRESREQELRVLTSSSAREILNRHGIELLSYRDLTSQALG